MVYDIGMKKTELTLKETISLMDDVFDQLSQGDTDTIDLVVAIENGGVFFGKYLADKLNKPLETVKIQFYGDGDKASTEPTNVNIDLDKLKNKNILLVDDIVDSGRTVDYFRKKTGLNQSENFILVSLHWCNGSLVEPDYFGTQKEKTEWIVYPWERIITFEEWWNQLCKK